MRAGAEVESITTDATANQNAVIGAEAEDQESAGFLVQYMLCQVPVFHSTPKVFNSVTPDSCTCIRLSKCCIRASEAVWYHISASLSGSRGEAAS